MHTIFSYFYWTVFAFWLNPVMGIFVCVCSVFVNKSKLSRPLYIELGFAIKLPQRTNYLC